MDRTFEIHKDTVAVQSPLAGISTTDPTAMEPSVYIDKEKTNPMDSSPDINTAIDKMTVKEDEEGTLDSNPPEPSPRGKIKRNKFVEYKESDLPDTEARLTDDQISLLFSTRPDWQPPPLRRYLTIERPELAEKTLLGYENPDKFTNKGEPRSYGDNEEKITRKRKRPMEDDTAESSSQPALKAIRDHTHVVDSSHLQQPNAGAPANSSISNHQQLCAESQTQWRYTAKPPFTELEPPDSYLHQLRIRLFAPVTSDLIEVLGKLEIGDHSSLSKWISSLSSNGSVVKVSPCKKLCLVHFG
ncbi:uncharacterized protein N7469_010129 [Penicillium citrinum]|uniref:Uncharacterized protein n=1 Tax=Penicillium citrinum TaxID=5077 RepID=A0A9W9NJU6_PENCI|nr:uncharacterized protein N7469_010129 [Penicillium citrinum]KAJ5221242.1 hypothetical protein N7469_010129 [Penicillium citrinum]